MEQRWPVSSGADFNPTGEKPKVGFAARCDYKGSAKLTNLLCCDCHLTIQ